MSTSLIALCGNHQQLKESIYQEYSGIDNSNECIPLPYSKPVPSSFIQDKYDNYQVLNTPSANTKEELMTIWNNLISISQMENLKLATIIYCFMDFNTDLNQLLNNLHKEMNFKLDQKEIILLTQPQVQFDQYSQIENRNTFQCIQIDSTKPQALLKQLKNKKLIKLQYLRLQIKEDKQNQIAIDICHNIFSKIFEIMKQSQCQADYIKTIFEEQFFTKILHKQNFNFKSEVSLFNMEVSMREIIQNKWNEFQKQFKTLKPSYFRYCQNQDCMVLYHVNTSKILEQLSQIQIALNNNYTSQDSCLKCQEKIFYLSGSQLIASAYQEIQFRIFDEINQSYQKQDSNEILQIMFLSHEEEEKKKVFNIIQENHSKEKSRQRHKFEKSSIIKDKYRFHNPPLFDFEKDSENTINTFRHYFYKNDIHFFFIFVKFERVDILISRIQDIIKKIHHLDRKQMALIVNQCLREKKQQQDLRQRLAYFNFKSINFFSNEPPSSICKSMFQILENVKTQKFDFTNSIFEEENDRDEQQSLQENLINMSRQIEEKQKNNCKIQLAQNTEYLGQLEMEIKRLEEILSQKKAQQRNLSSQITQDQYKLYDLEKYGIQFKF